ncbi:pyridoxamine 5'-phosphate oxidase family protein [Bacillota bacterium LX-D]|nr:pyridoxamine 5'-phosphate oxidase family protein [Bacillota bacterium LX-D]
MFKEMRRKDRSIDKEQAIELLKKGQYGILSTVGENGYAYGVPLNYIYYEGNIYYHCAVEGSKLDNIANNNRVSFCVVGNTEPTPDKFSYRYESVIVFGRAVEVYDKEKEAALVALIQKYSGEFMEKGIEYIQKDSVRTKVIKINIEHLTGKARK